MVDSDCNASISHKPSQRGWVHFEAEKALSARLKNVHCESSRQANGQPLASPPRAPSQDPLSQSPILDPNTHQLRSHSARPPTRTRSTIDLDVNSLAAVGLRPSRAKFVRRLQSCEQRRISSRSRERGLSQVVATKFVGEGT